jgi:MFS family permease
MPYGARPGHLAGHLGHVKLAPGITTTQAVVLVIVAIIGNLVMLVIPIMQPLILQNRLHLDTAVYGRIAGTLAVAQNVAMLVLVMPLGALGDRKGHKPLIYASMAGMGLGCFLYPFTPSLAIAILLNLMIGVGLAAFYAGVGACVLAYPDNTSRGRFVSVLIVTQNIATSVMIGMIGAHLPRWLTSMGYSPLISGGAVFWLLGLTCVLGAISAYFGFEQRQAVARAATPRPRQELHALGALLVQVMRHARAKPRFGLLIVLSCAFRANLVVVFTFLSLWVISAARATGVDSADALRTVGSLLIVLQVANLTATMIAGFVADRFDRSRLLLAALALGAASFSSPLLVTDILGWQVYAVVSFLGFSEGVSAVATQALLGQETPATLRGSVTGVFTVVGMLGAIGINAVGGELFDKVSFVAPFVMVGLVNLLCLLVCMLPGEQSFRRPAQTARVIGSR